MLKFKIFYLKSVLMLLKWYLDFVKFVKRYRLVTVG